ncbi:MAG: hypothetical protein NZM65_09565 [Flavobacteriales bacterium]|nr:hypothetical protein [Flavobacteriales bacterium]MDW8410917.1 hypothetical protein [Flavobacteriales bacterium]
MALIAFIISTSTIIVISAKPIKIFFGNPSASLCPFHKMFYFQSCVHPLGSIIFSMIGAQAPKQLAKVKLKNGNTSEGEIIEEVPADHIKLKLHNNKKKLFPTRGREYHKIPAGRP